MPRRKKVEIVSEMKEQASNIKYTKTGKIRKEIRKKAIGTKLPIFLYKG